MVTAPVSMPQQQVPPAATVPLHPSLCQPGQTLSDGGFTCFIYGDLGTWKTTFAGQAPRPLFISCGPEGGETALTNLPQIYNMPVPFCFKVCTVRELVQNFLPWIRQNAMAAGFCSIVFDSLTFYADLWISELMFERKRALVDTGKASADVLIMTQRDWGVLEIHLMKELAFPLHSTGLNVFWTALARKNTRVDPRTGDREIKSIDPYISGAAGTKLPALCKMVIYAEKQLAPDPKVPGRMMSTPVFYTSPSTTTQLPRHKYGLMFPEGRISDPNYYNLPTFRVLRDRIPWAIYGADRC